MPPLVSFLIATRNRPLELEDTLRKLKRQSYPVTELVVMDDASDTPLEPLVRRHFPHARYFRKDRNVGQCVCRTEGFTLARGKYIFQLDDDAAPHQAHDLQAAVDFLESNPHVGLLSFYIFNGRDFPAEPLSPQEPRYCASFVGCAALIRKEALEQTGGYIPFYGNEWEEEELSLRLLKAGWGLYFFPQVIVHHQVTPTNRRTPRTWMRGLRNKLWAQVMHLPLSRLPVEVSWTLGIASWDAIRLLRFHRVVQALFLFAGGLPRIIRLRRPMSPLTLSRYDALRFRSISTAGEFDRPPACGPGDILKWFTQSWWNRPRQRSIWDRRVGDTGRCETVKFAHEYSQGRKQ